MEDLDCEADHTLCTLRRFYRDTETPTTPPPQSWLRHVEITPRHPTHTEAPSGSLPTTMAAANTTNANNPGARTRTHDHHTRKTKRTVR